MPARNCDYLAFPVPEHPAVKDHPAVRALISEVPVPGSPWPASDRVRWLRAFAAVVAFLRGDDGEIRISALADDQR